jgi:hypothetical protein
MTHKWSYLSDSDKFLCIFDFKSPSLLSLSSVPSPSSFSFHPRTPILQTHKEFRSKQERTSVSSCKANNHHNLGKYIQVHSCTLLFLRVILFDFPDLESFVQSSQSKIPRGVYHIHRRKLRNWQIHIKREFCCLCCAIFWSTFFWFSSNYFFCWGK